LARQLLALSLQLEKSNLINKLKDNAVTGTYFVILLALSLLYLVNFGSNYGMILVFLFPYRAVV